MSVPRLLCVGEAFEDLVFVGLERLPQLGENVRTNSFSATIGGGAVITAVAAARLGVNVEVASGLSESAERRLRAEGVRVTNLRKRHEPPAITAALSAGGERAFVTFDGVNAVLEPRLARAIRHTRASHVHFALYPRNTRAWARRVRALTKRGITTSSDFGWNDALASDPGVQDLFDALTLVFLNEREAGLYSGANTVHRSLPFWRARKSTVVIKLGEKGSLAVGPHGKCLVRGRRVRPVDTTGAGDAFNGGFLSAWLRREPLTRCLQAGNRIGAASTKKAGGIEALPRRRRAR